MSISLNDLTKPIEIVRGGTGAFKGEATIQYISTKKSKTGTDMAEICFEAVVNGSPRTYRIFNLVYNLNILGKLLINLWRLFGPLRRYYHSNKNQRLYKKFEHLIPKNHTVRILKEWGHKVDS